LTAGTAKERRRNPMTKAIRIHATGGPEVLQYEDVDVPTPGAGELRIRHLAIGLNPIDLSHRTGGYPVKLPAVIGSEAVGVIETIGSGVTGFKAGDRVAYAPVIGAYSQARILPADRAVPVPDGLSDEQAAGMMLKGMTARCAIRSARNLKAGDTVLVQAVAGGVGLILAQWAKSLGATVIGTVGSEEKAKLARENGCHHVVLYRETDFVAAVNDLTKGEGVQAVFDGVGKDTFVKSIQCTAPFGTLVSYGQASGGVPPVDINLLRDRNVYMTRTALAARVAKRADLLATASELFDAVLKGAVKINVRKRYPLADIAQAHADLQAGKNSGSSILIP
jgi:NADPH:quinone reductase